MIDLNDYISLSDLSRDTSVSKNALLAYFTYHDLMRYPYRVRHKGQIYLRLDVAERYLQGRTTQRPKGWPTLKRLCFEAGVPRASRLIIRLTKDLQVVRFRHAMYVHPDDAKLFLTRIKALRPLPGWVLVGESAKKAGRTRPALTSWAKRRGIEMREFIDDSGKPPKLYIHERHAEKYIATRKRKEGDS